MSYSTSQEPSGGEESDSLVVCDVDPDLKDRLRKFRFRKETNNAAILMKIDKDKQLVVLQEEFEVHTFTFSHLLVATTIPVSLPPSSKPFWLGVSLPEQLTEEEQEVRNSDKENKEKKHLEGKSKEKDISPDDLQNELPERQPRFLVYSYKYKHEDGRVSYPLCMIFSSPIGCKPEQQMMYAGSKNRLVQIAELTKVFEIRNTSDLTEEWLRERLAFFR